jgi:glycosyltransferase involved in cell wall biosynthesis
MKKYSLAIVQTHATQFDGPLFRLLSTHPEIDLTVYYTSRQAHALSYDPELKRRSGWDHDITSGYTACFFPDSSFERWGLLNSIMKHGRYDLVIVSGYNSRLTLTLAALGKVYRTAVGLRGDSVFTHRESTVKWWLKEAVLPNLFRLYATGHPTGSLTRAVMQRYGMPEESLFYFPYAIDNDYFIAEAAKYSSTRNDMRQALGIGPNDFVVLGVLKFVPREDPLTLLAAYGLLVKQHPHTHLVLVGDGCLMPDIVNKVSARGHSHVHLAGYLPYSQLASYYSLADVFVHPAKVEPWGVSVNEAMACGLPVIAADTVGAGADLIKEGKTGFTYKAGEPALLAEQIEKLILEPARRKAMGLCANKCVAEWGYAKTIGQCLRALEFVTARY